MCGIAGMAALVGHLADGADTVVDSMAETLIHRGPDGAGVWSNGVVALGHRRLAVIDLSEAGAQPMQSATGRYVISFNGEVYNYRDISAELEGRGWRPQGSSDTEVLLAAIEAWGVEATLQRVDGMLAFALYDTEAGLLHLARDRFGEKPLCYTRQGDTLWFASELRALDVVGGPELLLDPEATAAYFRYGFVPAPASIYHGVAKVPPGALVSLSLAHGGRDSFQPSPPVHSVGRYWAFPTSVDATSPTGHPALEADEVLEVLRGSVRNRLQSDRPIGAFLSGGIDSSLTCALAAEALPGSLRTFTMVWEDREYDESDQAARVASAIGASHHEVALPLSESVGAVESIGSILDEPHADYSIIATYLVSREARRQFVVAMTGDGGDELFAGYNRHTWLPRAASLRNRLPRALRRPAARGLSAAGPLIEFVGRPIPVARRPRLLADKVGKLARALGASDEVTAYDAVLAIDTSMFGTLVLPAPIAESLSSEQLDEMLWGLRSADLAHYLPDDVLTKVDRATMSVSLEGRTPFLNHELAEVAGQLGWNDLVGPHGGKQPLRSLLADLLPDCDFSSPKSGFGTPIGMLLRGPLASLTEDSVSTFISRPLPPSFGGRDWHNALERFMGGDEGEAHRVWAVVAFELWAAQRTHPIEWAEASPVGSLA